MAQWKKKNFIVLLRLQVDSARYTGVSLRDYSNIQNQML